MKKKTQNPRKVGHFITEILNKIAEEATIGDNYWGYDVPLGAFSIEGLNPDEAAAEDVLSKLGPPYRHDVNKIEVINKLRNLKRSSASLDEAKRQAFQYAKSLSVSKTDDAGLTGKPPARKNTPTLADKIEAKRARERLERAIKARRAQDAIDTRRTKGEAAAAKSKAKFDKSYGLDDAGLTGKPPRADDYVFEDRRANRDRTNGQPGTTRAVRALRVRSGSVEALFAPTKPVNRPLRY